MIKDKLHQLGEIETPCYIYDTERINQALAEVKKESGRYGFKVHYALKANTNPQLLSVVAKEGLGADCVSGNEVLAAVEAGFPAESIVFAGVGKTDKEIIIGLKHGIGCFNVESLPELEVINELAAKEGVQAPVALRINPRVEANTHAYITTGLDENKFGINMVDMENILSAIKHLDHINLEGIHFHIGSQITTLEPFKDLCARVNEILRWFEAHQIMIKHINVGGGLGVDYENPEENPHPDFKAYFKLFKEGLSLNDQQVLHFELGRSIMANMGYLLTKVLYVKQGLSKQFVIVDAGMTELIRPALYQARHQIENISSEKGVQPYDIVGPICESSDSFGHYSIKETKRGDLLVIYSAGAYAKVMSSSYNLRTAANEIFLGGF